MKGLSALDNFNTRYGEKPNQGTIQNRGNAFEAPLFAQQQSLSRLFSPLLRFTHFFIRSYLEEEFPDLDYILFARLTRFKRS